MVGVAEDADGVSLQIADVLEQELPCVLPKDVILVLEQAVFDHLCLILAHQKLLDLVRVAHPHRLRLFQRVHEVEVGGLAHIADHWIWLGIVLVVEAQAPRCFVAFLLEADGCVELHSDGHVPLEGPRVVVEPPASVVLYLVLRCILIEERLHIGQDVEKVVFSRCHDLSKNQ